jgi:hypothetical protein
MSGDLARMGAREDEPAPLNGAEIAELDSYGPLDAFTHLPARALELREREILWGRLVRPREFGGLPSDLRRDPWRN